MLETLEPEFIPVRVSYFGQPEDIKERVVCPVCGGLTNLRFTAWFDSYNHTYGPKGCYVHYKCLSEERKSEISTDKHQG